MNIYNPRQTVLVTCRGKIVSFGKEEEIDEIIPLEWHSPASSNPKRYAIFIHRDSLAAKLIRESKVWAINFMPFELAEAITLAAKHSAEMHAKWEKIKLSPIECEVIDCPRVREALAWLECELIQEVDCGDHVLFLGRIVFSRSERGGKRAFCIDGKYTTTIE